MQSYLATFPAGCYDIVARELKKFGIDELKFVNHDDSSITFDTSLKPERLVDFRFFTNVFMILGEHKLTECKPYLKGNSFRLIALVNGEPAQIKEAQRAALVNLIAKDLGLKANAARYSNDFVLLKRQGLPEVLTFRLPRAKYKREKLAQGTLRPELANVLLLVAGVKSKDVLLDPFAGYGSIPLEALRGFGLKHVMAIEKDDELVRQMQGKGFEAKKDDATLLETVSSNSVDRVVTDPPWGIYDKADDLSSLYHQSFATISRVLKPDGIAVFLSGGATLDQVIKENKDFIVLKSFGVLVSGKKANIIKLQKKLPVVTGV